MKKIIVFLLLNVIIFPVISQEKPQLTEAETFQYIKKYYDQINGCTSKYNPDDNDTYTLSTEDCFFVISGDEVKFKFKIDADVESYNGDREFIHYSKYAYSFNPSKIKDIRISDEKVRFEINNATRYIIELTDFSGGKNRYGNTNKIVLYCYSNANDGFTFEKVKKAWLYLSELWKKNHIQEKDPFE